MYRTTGNGKSINGYGTAGGNLIQILSSYNSRLQLGEWTSSLYVKINFQSILYLLQELCYDGKLLQ